MGSGASFARSFAQSRVDRNEWTRRLRIGHDFRRRDAPLSWLTHRCVSRAARTRCDVESPLGVSPFQQRRCDFARWRRTGRWPAESQRRRLSPRISTRRWVADLDLSCARLGFRKAGNSSALTKHSTCDLPHSERRQSSATRVAPGVSFSSSRDSGEQRHCRALQAHRGERPLRDRAGPARISRLANEIVQLRIGFHHCGQEDSASCVSHRTKPRLCPRR